jgi:hypothetical protein
MAMPSRKKNSPAPAVTKLKTQASQKLSIVA